MGRLRTVSLLSCFGLPSAFGAAQTPDARVDALLAQVAKAYRRAGAFGATIETRMIDRGKETKRLTALALKKPGFARADISLLLGKTRLVADGTAIYSDSSRDATSYTKQPGTSTATVVEALGKAGGLGVGVLPILLTSSKLETDLLPGPPRSVRLLPAAIFDHVTCDVVRVVVGSPSDRTRYEYAFGKRDHLLRRLMIGPDSDAWKPTDIRTIETYTNVTLKPASGAGRFKYVPKPGAVSTNAPTETPMFDPRTRAGASPLPIVGQDLDERPVDLGQFKGKVVLLDFWATWCGPCVGELPNLVACYDKYHPQGFEVVGISLDVEGKRDVVRDFAAQHKMPWRQIYDGKHWAAGNVVTYGVQSIPFTVLIGRDGKIAAVGARGDALAPAIEKALAQGPESK